MGAHWQTTIFKRSLLCTLCFAFAVDFKLYVCCQSLLLWFDISIVCVW
uniref:Ubiquitin n=1 Tax=Rhizophora mucronata TaxID=61149 RepID=A0A2P2LYN0_RHIMU